MKKNDLIIIITGLLIALAVYGGLQLNNSRYSDADKRIGVYIEGVLEDEFQFTDEGVYTYTSDRGTNVVEIKNGSVRIIEADCLTQSCISDGAIDSVNDTVVCLPHHFHIAVTGSEEVEIDAISQ